MPDKREPARYEDAMEGDPSRDYGPEALRNPSRAPRMFDSSPDVMARMDEADMLHGEMHGRVSGMGDEETVKRDPASRAVRRYMSGSVKVAIESEAWTGVVDCLEALPCKNGVTLVYRADRNPRGLPPDGCACVLGLNGTRAETRYTGVSWKSPGLGICGAAFIFAGRRAAV